MRQSYSGLVLLTLLVSNVAMGSSTAERVVSLDFCADQYVLKMLPRSHILAISPDADSHFSYMRDAAEGIPQVRPLAENILNIQPDLVVRSYGGGPRVGGFLERVGVDVLQLPYTNNLAQIRDAILSVSERLGVPASGREMLRTMDARLESIAIGDADQEALYMTPTGATSGPGTLVHEMLQTAGIENFEKSPGWRSIPLERLAYEQPDLVVAAFFDDAAVKTGLWSPMRHPLAKRQLQDQTTVMPQGAWTSCGAWFLMDAIEAIASASVTTSSPK